MNTLQSNPDNFQNTNDKRIIKLKVSFGKETSLTDKKSKLNEYMSVLAQSDTFEVIEEKHLDSTSFLIVRR